MAGGVTNAPKFKFSRRGLDLFLAKSPTATPRRTHKVHNYLALACVCFFTLGLQYCFILIPKAYYHNTFTGGRGGFVFFYIDPERVLSQGGDGGFVLLYTIIVYGLRVVVCGRRCLCLA